VPGAEISKTTVLLDFKRKQKLGVVVTPEIPAIWQEELEASLDKR
jgi:hypothetical protein